MGDHLLSGREPQLLAVDSDRDLVGLEGDEVVDAVDLNDVPIDVLALHLGSNRNAVYKNLFDARRSLRTSLASASHPVIEEDAITR
jgi:hypothetical protein